MVGGGRDGGRGGRGEGWWAWGEGRNPSLRSVKRLNCHLTDASWAVKRTGNHTGFVIYSYF